MHAPFEGQIFRRGQGHAGRGDASFASAVRAGTAQGVSFGRVQRWQAVVGGCVFAALAFASLFMGL